MSELEQIAKQVSLLNRLIELLRMQEEPTSALIEEYGWLYCNGIRESDMTYYLPGVRDDKGLLLMLTITEAWNHPITQKAWSDELVKVAKELYQLPYNHEIRLLLFEIANKINAKLIQHHVNDKDEKQVLITILQKFGRSLSE